jgi:Flp pilus assembly protein TadD
VLNNLAWLLRRQGNLEEARTTIEEALRLRPEMVQALDTLAMLQIDTEEFEAARDTLRKAEMLDPEMPDLKIRLALLYARQGDPARSLRLLDSMENQFDVLSTSAQEEYEALRKELRAKE